MRAPLLATLVAVVFAVPAIGQIRNARYGEGTDYFRYILKRNRAIPFTDEDALLVDPETKCLIVFGRTEILDRLSRDHVMRRFLERGGRVLIATDRRTSDAVYEEIGVQISGETWEMPDGFPYAIYRESFNQCPLVADAGRFRTKKPSAPFFQTPVADTGSTLTRIATNLPSEIVRTRFYDTVATFVTPGHSFRIVLGDRYRDQAMLGAQSLRWNRNLLVLADHSIFINDMMCQADNDNAPFANNIVEWLMDAGNGKRRTEVLFCDDGHIQTDFDVSLEYPPQTVPPLIPLADEIAVGLERDNAFNESLLEMTGGLSPILRVAAGSLTVILLLFGLYRFMQARHRPEYRVPPAPGEFDALAARIPTLERRHQAVIAQGNLAETARELAYQAFASIGLFPTADSPAPMVVIPNGWAPFRARRWRREVRDLWSIAARGPDHRVSPAALERMDVTLRNLLAAIADGRVRMAVSDSAI